jgi:hypothetical protein
MTSWRPARSKIRSASARCADPSSASQQSALEDPGGQDKRDRADAGAEHEVMANFSPAAADHKARIGQ